MKVQLDVLKRIGVWGEVRRARRLGNRVRRITQRALESKLPIESAQHEKLAAMVIFARSADTNRAVQLLGKRGYGQDGLILLRSQLDALITIAYIRHSKEARSRAEQFLKHSFVANEAVLDEFLKNPVKIPGGKIPAATLQQIRDDSLLAKASGSTISSWSGKTTEVMLREIDNHIGEKKGEDTRLYQEQYITFRHLSAEAHVSSSILSQYMSLEEKQMVKLKRIDRRRWAVEAVLSSSAYLLAVAEIVGDIFDLGIAERLEDELDKHEKGRWEDKGKGIRSHQNIG